MELSEGELFGDLFCGDGGLLCKAEEREASADPNNGAGVGTVGPGSENMGTL